MKRFASRIVACAIVAACWAAYAGFAAWSNGVPGEFREVGTGVWKAELFELIGMWWLIVFVPLSILTFVVTLIGHLIDRGRVPS